MEVHAHSHIERKKWTHYLWEFLMLFLAVFCGFLAENQREHYVEHQREKQYIRSLISDIATDTANINKMNGWFKLIQKNCDSVLIDLEGNNKYYSRNKSRHFRRVVNGYPDYIYTDRTMQQLKNAGGLRLIRNLSAADSIIGYDAAVRDALREEESIDQYWSALNEFMVKNFSSRKFAEQNRKNTDEEIEKMKINFWLISDSKDFDQLYNLVLYYRNIVNVYSGLLADIKVRGTRLINLLNKEYRLK
jgi:hypothetical protein